MTSSINPNRTKKSTVSKFTIRLMIAMFLTLWGCRLVMFKRGTAQEDALQIPIRPNPFTIGANESHFSPIEFTIIEFVKKIINKTIGIVIEESTFIKVK